MHSYLRAIGFSTCKSRKQLESIYQRTLRNPNRKIITTISVDTSLIQLEKDFGESFGVTLIGEIDINQSLSVEHYFPYIRGDKFMQFESITIEKQTDKESYAGVCEDVRLGMTLIFYVLNIADFAKSKWLNYSNRNITQVKFSALSNSGTILLGVKKDKNAVRYERERLSYHNQLLQAAKAGDIEAYESLTIDEMDTYTSITARIKNEDMLSIVDTSFMPCGVECDHYLIIGNILNVSTLSNEVTGETVYNLLVEANNIAINVGINQKDLLGEPKEGRRFRGEIWLMGIIRI